MKNMHLKCGIKKILLQINENKILLMWRRLWKLHSNEKEMFPIEMLFEGISGFLPNIEIIFLSLLKYSKNNSSFI